MTRGSFPGGVAGEHPPTAGFRLLVGPATSDEFNTAKLRLIPVACWRVDDLRFAFDSSFVLPEIAAEMKALAALIGDHPGCPLSIFGHADPVGSDDNKTLSGRRAQAIYGLLTRRSEIWEDLFSNNGHFVEGAPGDRWGDKALQVMQSTVLASSGGTGIPSQRRGRLRNASSCSLPIWMRSAAPISNCRPRIFWLKAPTPRERAMSRGAANSIGPVVFGAGSKPLR